MAKQKKPSGQYLLTEEQRLSFTQVDSDKAKSERSNSQINEKLQKYPDLLNKATKNQNSSIPLLDEEALNCIDLLACLMTYHGIHRHTQDPINDEDNSI